MRLASISSGSSGNCIYVGSDKTNLLIDAGISGKRIENGLKGIGVLAEDVDGILITHEHADHISSIGVMSRRYSIPIYATGGTIEGIMASPGTGAIDESLFNEIEAGDDFSIGDIKVHPQSISHDANDPVAYRFFSKGRSAAVVTDLGVYDEDIVEAFYGVNALLLEANHDVNMLQVGRYPYYLKRRILGDKGHLSNESAGKLLCRLLTNELHTVLLGHLSAENNLPELAFEAVRLELMMGSKLYDPQKVKLKVASRSECSEIINV